MRLVKTFLLLIMLFLPLAGGGISALFSSPQFILYVGCGFMLLVAAIATLASVLVFNGWEIATNQKWLSLDSLSAYHLLIMTLVFVLVSFYAIGYFKEELTEKKIKLKEIRQYIILWFASYSSMILVLISNNMGIMWVGIELTTLLTSFLISLQITKTSLEAMWKYLIICSVGVGLAFIGTILLGAAAKGLNLGFKDSLLWTELIKGKTLLNPIAMKVCFIFALVGYGTKAGLAPMHNWLPDAHSQAPSPVSAVFSGFMLNAALYCIMRFIPLVEGATGNVGWTNELLRIIGLTSIIVAAGFIILQHDVKRLFAYSSVEHLGIITFGLGIGGLGTFAALFHSLNHSICKSMGFFSSGRLGQIYRTHEMKEICGSVYVSPAWGIQLFVALLALIGVAPFAIFMSEFQILKSGLDSGRYIATVLFLVGIAIVFVGALRQAISMTFGKASKALLEVKNKNSIGEWVFVFVPMIIILILGIHMPIWLKVFIKRAAEIIGGQI